MIITNVLLSIKIAFYSVTFQDLFYVFIVATNNLFLEATDGRAVERAGGRTNCV